MSQVANVLLHQLHSSEDNDMHGKQENIDLQCA